MSFNFNTNGTVRITVTGFNEILSGLRAMQNELPQTKLNIIREATTFFFKDAQKNAHVITGKTKASIHIDSITQQQGIISAGHGMPHEEKRGGQRMDTGTPHKTFSTTAKTTVSQFPVIIKKDFDTMFNKHKTR